MEKSGKLNHEGKKKWCRYHQTNGYSNKQCFQQIKKLENSRMEGRKNHVACILARVIQIKNDLSRRVAVNVRTVLMLVVKIAKNMKPML